MEWVKAHYTAQSKNIGRAEIWEHQPRIAEQLQRWCREIPNCRRVLELGAGACGVAALMAQEGYEVHAVEFNSSDLELARQLAARLEVEGLHIVDADFYEVSFDEKFDFIYYWDGFGVGADSDQRRLLSRIGNEWLRDEGFAIIDVFSPWNWQRRSGQISRFQANDGTPWTKEIRFDAINSRFIDFARPDDGRDIVLSQSIRLYSMPEFVLLTEGTGTRVAAFYPGFDQEAVELGRPCPETSDALVDTNGFYAKLVKDTAGD